MPITAEQARQELERRRGARRQAQPTRRLGGGNATPQMVERPAWETTPEATQSLRIPRQTRVPRFTPEEQRQLEIETEAQGESERARREYSPLGDEWGPVVPLTAMVGDLTQSAIDSVGASEGVPGAQQRLEARDRRYARGTRQAGEDILAEGHGGQLIDFFSGLPDDLAEADRARVEAGGEDSPLARAGAMAGGLWTGMSAMGRDARGNVAAEDARRDYASRDWEIANERGNQAFNRGDMQAAGEADLEARSSSRTGRTAELRGDEAAGADFWANAPWALEFAPEFGMVQGLVRAPARVGLRAAGQEVPEALARPNLLSETQAPGVRTGQTRRLANGETEDVLHSATNNARGWRNNAIVGGATYAGADALDGEMGDDPGASLMAAGGAMALGRRFIPSIETAAEAPLRARRLGDAEPYGFEGAPRTPEIIDAEATPTVPRNFEAAVRDPETGRVYAGEDHNAAIDSIPDEVTRARLQALYDAPTEDPGAIGFNVNGQFMGREEGLQSLRSQRRPVRVGENLDRRTDQVRANAADPIDWENGRDTFAARDLGMGIVPPGGIPRRTADDMLRDTPRRLGDGPDAGQSGAGNLAWERGSQTAKIGDAELVYAVGQDGNITLNSLRVPENMRRGGQGRAAMETLLAEADRRGATVYLTPQYIMDGTPGAHYVPAMDNEALTRFYRSLGFRRNSGRNRDFSSTEEMLRLPRNAPDGGASGAGLNATGDHPGPKPAERFGYENMTSAQWQRMLDTPIVGEETVPIDRLISIQRHLRADHDPAAAAAAYDSGRLPQVYRAENGSLYILDGHSRLTGLAARGDQTVRVRVRAPDAPNASTPRRLGGDDAAAIAGIAGTTGLGAGVIADQFNQTARADDGSGSGGAGWMVPTAVGTTAATLAGIYAALKRRRGGVRLGVQADTYEGAVDALRGLNGPEIDDLARTFGVDESAPDRVQQIARRIADDPEGGEIMRAGASGDAMPAGTQESVRPVSGQAEYETALRQYFDEMEPDELDLVAARFGVDPDAVNARELTEAAYLRAHPTREHLDFHSAAINEAAGGIGRLGQPARAQIAEQLGVESTNPFQLGEAFTAPLRPEQRSRLNSAIGVGLTGAGGGYLAGELLNGEAQADDGSESGGDPLLPILTAGGGAAALLALRRGRLGEQFGDSVGMSGGRPRRGADPLADIAPPSRSANVTAEPQPTANAQGTAREPGSMLTDSRLNRDQNYAAGRAMDGASPRAIAEEMDTTASYVRVLLANARELAPDLEIPRGTPGRAQDGLTERARALRAQGLSYEEIGAELNMSASAAKSRVNLPRSGDGAAAVAGGVGLTAGGALLANDAQASDDRFSTPRYLEARAGDEEAPPRIPAAMRIGGAIGTGIIARNLAGRLGARGMAQEIPGAAAAYGANRYVLGGDPEEAALTALATPALRYAGEQGGRRLGQAFDGYLDGEAARSLNWTPRDHELNATPAHNRRVNDFAMSLPGEPTRVRGMSGENYGGQISREEEGLRPVAVGDREIAEQGYSTNRPGTTEVSPRDEFLAMTPARQEEWMDRQHFRMDWVPEGSPERVAQGRQVQGRALEAPQPPPPPPPARGMPPMNRNTRGERTASTVQRRASTRPAGQTLDGFIEAAGREGVTVTPQGKSVAARARAVADAIRSNPRLEQLARDWGLAALLTAGGVAAFSANDAEASDGEAHSSLDPMGYLAGGAVATGALAGGLALAEGARNPTRMRLGHASRVSEVPFHEPATSLLARGAAARADARLLETLPFGSNTSPAMRRLLRDQRGPLHTLDGGTDPLDAAAWTALFAGPVAWGTAELIDPQVTTPQEQDARYSRDVMPYLELRQRALELHWDGITSSDMRATDPEMADELAQIEAEIEAGGTEGARRLRPAAHGWREPR